MAPLSSHVRSALREEKTIEKAQSSGDRPMVTTASLGALSHWSRFGHRELRACQGENAAADSRTGLRIWNNFLAGAVIKTIIIKK